MFYVTKQFGNNIIVPKAWVIGNYFYWPDGDITNDEIRTPQVINFEWSRFALKNAEFFGIILYYKFIAQIKVCWGEIVLNLLIL